MAFFYRTFKIPFSNITKEHSLLFTNVVVKSPSESITQHLIFHYINSFFSHINGPLFHKYFPKSSLSLHLIKGIAPESPSIQQVPLQDFKSHTKCFSNISKEIILSST